MDSERFDSIAEEIRASEKQMTVIGDRMSDMWFTVGHIGHSKESEKTPLYRIVESHTRPGGAANVIETLAALKPMQTVSHFVSGLSEKYRFFSRDAKRVIAQFDRDSFATPMKAEGNLAKLFLSKFMVISDYGKGMLTWPTLDGIAEYANAGKLTVIFSPHINQCKSAAEVKNLIRRRFGHWLWVMNNAEAGALNGAVGVRPQFCLVTRGQLPVLYYRDDTEKPESFPVTKVDARITAGIGDVFLAALSAAISAGKKVPEAAPFSIECCRRVLKANRITTCSLRKSDLEIG